MVIAHKMVGLNALSKSARLEYAPQALYLLQRRWDKMNLQVWEPPTIIVLTVNEIEGGLSNDIESNSGGFLS